jgi:drug/metabolite transporter (DMT)-like permease
MASLSRISDVTAIWNTNAFWAYLMNVHLHNSKVQMRKLSAVLLACVGVLFVVYGGQSASSDQVLSSSSSSTPTNPNTTSGSSAPFIGDLLTLIASIGYAAYQVLYKRFVSLPSDPDESISAPPPPYSPLSSTRAGYEPLVTDDDASLLPSHPSPTHSSAPSNGLTLPFGLYPNLLTSAIGIVTFIALWPLLVVLHWTGAEKFTLPADGRTWASIAGIALGGVTFNAGYMVCCVTTHSRNPKLSY